MKRQLMLLLLIFAATGSSAAAWTDQAIDRAMTQMEQHDRSGVDSVLHAPGDVPSYLLLMAAKVAAEKGLVEDAGFLLCAGMMRYRVDLAAFPDNSGDPEPEVVVTAAAEQLGPWIVPILLADPPMLERLFDRLKQWRPAAPPGYSPGWALAGHPGPKNLEKMVAQEKAQLLPVLKSLAAVGTGSRASRVPQSVVNSSPESREGGAHFEAEPTRVERRKDIPALFRSMTQ